MSDSSRELRPEPAQEPGARVLASVAGAASQLTQDTCWQPRDVVYSHRQPPSCPRVGKPTSQFCPVAQLGSAVQELSTSSLLGVQTGSWEGVRAPFKVTVKGDADLTPVPSDISPGSSWDSVSYCPSGGSGMKGGRGRGQVTGCGGVQTLRSVPQGPADPENRWSKG